MRQTILPYGSNHFLRMCWVWIISSQDILYSTMRFPEMRLPHATPSDHPCSFGMFRERNQPGTPTFLPLWLGDRSRPFRCPIDGD